MMTAESGKQMEVWSDVQVAFLLSGHAHLCLQKAKMRLGVRQMDESTWCACGRARRSADGTTASRFAQGLSRESGTEDSASHHPWPSVLLEHLQHDWRTVLKSIWAEAGPATARVMKIQLDCPARRSQMHALVSCHRLGESGAFGCSASRALTVPKAGVRRQREDECGS
eukprot:6200182-Pleurochrysis_carterae.AAC.2